MFPRHLFSLFLLLLSLRLGAQTAEYVPDWQVVAQRIGEGQYRIRFTAPIQKGWQLYAPNQVLADFPVSAIKFSDSIVKADAAFTFSPAGVSVASEVFGQPILIQQGTVSWEMNIAIQGAVPAVLTGELSYCYDKPGEFYPAVYSFQVPLDGGQPAVAVASDSNLLQPPLAGCGDAPPENKSLLQIFLLGVLGGLISLLTPCVFPMVPVTVTFFTKKSVSRKTGIFRALLYGLFIFLIYVVITIPFHIAGSAISPEIFNKVSSNPWLNLFLFFGFVAFALSFFGLYEMSLPASLANRADARSGLSSLTGIFFMAATLVIVSFSCTGPILGTLLVEVAEQGAWPLTTGAAGFGLALGLPFALFALFPGWLQSLPRSGDWMTEFKFLLGCVELALAIKFLSIADLEGKWGFLKREVFLLAWIIIGVVLLLYLSGWKRKLPKPILWKKSPVRIFMIGIVLAFTLYMIPGLTNRQGSKQELLSGILPPLSYSIYPQKEIYLRNDLVQALAQAKARQKPILIDFTGWNCANCRRMEENVWGDERVQKLMNEEFVVLSLYVDEKTKLPLAEQELVTMPDGRQHPLVTVGDKWAHFQIKYFGATSQPQYAIITADQRILTRSKFYTPDPKDFADWLNCGLTAYRKLP